MPVSEMTPSSRAFPHTHSFLSISVTTMMRLPPPLRLLLAVLAGLLLICSTSSLSSLEVGLDGSSTFALAWHARRLADVVVEEQRRALRTTEQFKPPSSSGKQKITEAVSLQPICQAIEDNFVEDVSCVCTGSSVRTFSIACHYAQQVCSPSQRVCGRPMIGLSMVESSLFSTSACVFDYQRQRGLQKLPDTCITIDVTPHEETGRTTFSSCTAQHGGQTCEKCEVCGDGEGVSMDCRNLNAEVVTSDCTSVDVDLNIGGVQSSITAFVPNLNGLCSQLEAGLDNRIACDCSDTGGGNFTVSCHNVENECSSASPGLCGKIDSSVTYEDGNMRQIQTCSDIVNPVDLQETCTIFTLDDTDGVSQCRATYGGTNCRACSLCTDENDAPGVTMDCSNLAAWAIADNKCQSTQGLAGKLDFVPAFLGDAPKDMVNNAQSGVAATLRLPAVASLVAAALFLAIQ